MCYGLQIYLMQETTPGKWDKRKCKEEKHKYFSKISCPYVKHWPSSRRYSVNILTFHCPQVTNKKDGLLFPCLAQEIFYMKTWMGLQARTVEKSIPKLSSLNSALLSMEQKWQPVCPGARIGDM